MRIIAVLFSYKWPWITKTYLQLDLFCLLVNHCMPVDICGLQVYSLIFTLRTAISLMFFDFNMWYSMISIVIARIIFMIIRITIFDDSLKENFSLFIQVTLFLILVLMISNFQSRYAGYLYVEQAIHKKEGDRILDSLDTGIIILDKETFELQYINKVAYNSKLLQSQSKQVD